MTKAADRVGATERASLYRLLVENVQGYAIFALDPLGYVRSWNAGAERLKGFTADEIVGQHFSVFYPRDDVHAGKPQRVLDAATTAGRADDEGWRVRKDGSQFWANVVVTPLYNPDGSLLGFAKMTRDLTERREMNERAITDARRVATAEGANRAKTDFLAAMSHELRTPLNAIGGYAELLEMGLGGPVSAEQADYLDRIRRSQQHLLGIINDILNFSRIEAGQVTYDIRPTLAAEMVDGVLPMIQPQVLAKGLRLTTSVAASICVAADRGKLEQVLLNLLSNAVKFTAHGTIEVTGFATLHRAGIRVHDTGIGIPPERLDSIFEPFVQVGRSLTTRHEGTGLGLTISRDLTRAMGGDLTVESELGKGTTFTVSLKRVR